MAASKFEQADRVTGDILQIRRDLNAALKTLADYKKTNAKRLNNKHKAQARRARKAAANAVTPVEGSGSAASEEEANVDV